MGNPFKLRPALLQVRSLAHQKLQSVALVKGL